LAPQPSLGLGLLQKIRLNFLEASQQFSFLQARVISPGDDSRDTVKLDGYMWTNDVFFH
jgi:hypothetical protein